MPEKRAEKKKRTLWQKISLNIQILLLIVVIILLAFFGVYMYKTSLDDVLSKENTDSNGSSAVVTTVYEQGGDISSQSE